MHIARYSPLLNFSNVFQVAIAVTRYMLISHFSLYMKCFTKPLIAASLLAVWLFSFGWMVGGPWRFFQHLNCRCHHCCQCGAPWEKTGRPSPAQSSGTPRAGSATESSVGELNSWFCRSPKMFLFLLGFTLPCLAIIICYSAIFYRVRTSRQAVVFFQKALCIISY